MMFKALLGTFHLTTQSTSHLEAQQTLMVGLEVFKAKWRFIEPIQNAVAKSTPLFSWLPILSLQL